MNEREQREAKAALELERDKARRAQLDRAAGHLPSCTLGGCDPHCERAGK